MPTTEQDEIGWWVRCDEVASLYRFLVDTDRLDPKDVDAVVRFLSKPHNWSKERQEMLSVRVSTDEKRPKRLSVVAR